MRQRTGPIHLSGADLEKEALPHHTASSPDIVAEDKSRRSKNGRKIKYALLGVLATLATMHLMTTGPFFPLPKPQPKATPDFVQAGLMRCEEIRTMPPDTSSFAKDRKISDRFEEGTRPVLLSNGTLWTGGENGEEVIYGGSVLLKNGIVWKIGKHEDVLAEMKAEGLSQDEEVETVQLDGKWVSPGIVDTHSHAMVDAAPSLASSADTNSLRANIQPWLASVNGFNIHGLELPLIRAGGISTMLILPGSANNMGGQAFVVKSRITSEDTPSSMIVEPPFAIVPDGNSTTYKRTGHWRHMKQAMGENILRVHGMNRLDQAAEFRMAYLEGQKLKDSQDKWCSAGKENTEPFPEDYKWEVLADVIRGKVKVNTHSYTSADFDAFARLTNEFKWTPAAMHHAHEAYLSRSLDKVYGGKPALALFATNARYKQEANLGSPYAPYILVQRGYEVTFKSDHPVLDSRYLPYEAQQSIQYGLNASTALKAITVTPANRLGLGHRVGHLLKGYDADAVVWDSNPLSLGATPIQTYIDGIPQIEKSFTIVKPDEAQKMPKTRDVSKEAAETMKYRGDPPLKAKHSAKNVIFQGVSAVFLKRDGHSIQEVKLVKEGEVSELADSRVIVTDGEITCAGTDCATPASSDYESIDLDGGVITTGLTSYGSYMGLMQIRQERVTTDGKIPDTLSEGSSLLEGIVSYGKDGATFGGKDQLIAYASGVTKGIVHPIESGTFQGVSYSYATNGKTSLDGLVDDVAAVHIGLGQSSKLSIATQIGVLRALLSGEYPEKTELTRLFKNVAKEDMVLVVEVDKADIMANLIRLKSEFSGLKMTFVGAHESWMIADDIAKAEIGVIVSPARSYPGSYDSRHILPGLPLSPESLPVYLHNKGITVGLGITEEWMARNIRLDAAWTYINANASLSKAQAMEMVSSNLDKLLGLESKENAGWVAWQGDFFSMNAKVSAVRGEGRASVDMF